MDEAEKIEKAGTSLPGKHRLRDGVDPLAVLGRAEDSGASPAEQPAAQALTVEEFTPYSESLEWRLSRTYWEHSGLQPFVAGAVPYLVNNSGWLAERSANLLFDACVQADWSGPLQILELGAGSGLFARRLLDAFVDRCRVEPADYHQRLTYHVTDGSRRTVQRWQEVGLFSGHEDRASPAVCDADAPTLLTGLDGRAHRPAALHAVFANYALDSLDAAALRTKNGELQVLCARTLLPPSGIEAATAIGLSPERIGELVRGGSEADLVQLLPLLEHFEFATTFRRLDDSKGEDYRDLDLADGRRCVVNHGAAEALIACVESLAPGGFALVHDFGATTEEEVHRLSHPSRFAESVAWPINFAWLERRVASSGARCVKLEGQATDPIHARLFGAPLGEDLVRAFRARFSDPSPARADARLNDASEAIRTGRHDEAIACYREALELLPRDWNALGLAAQFLNQQQLRHDDALQLAAAALRLNPWFSPFLWNTYGNCLFCLGELRSAHECYLEAAELDPHDAQAQLNLAYSFAEQGELPRSLECIARGLACDRGERFRTALLHKQREILVRLDQREADAEVRRTRRNERFRAPG